MSELEKTFKAYIKEYNPKVPVSEEGFMNGRVWRHFVTNLDLALGLERILIGCEVFDEHCCGTHVEGVETMNYKEFSAAIDDLLQRNEDYCKRKGMTPVPSRDTILAKITETPVTIKMSAKWINKCAKRLRAKVSGETTSNVGDTAATTMEAIRAIAASSATDLAAIEGTVPEDTLSWVAPIIQVFKEVWGHVKAFKTMDASMEEFAALLKYASDTIVYININNLYCVKNTKKRLQGLEDILKKSRKVLQKVNQHQTNKTIKLFTFKRDQLKLTEQKLLILDWLNSLQVEFESEQTGIQLELQEADRSLEKSVTEVHTRLLQISKKIDELDKVVNQILLQIQRCTTTDVTRPTIYEFDIMLHDTSDKSTEATKKLYDDLQNMELPSGKKLRVFLFNEGKLGKDFTELLEEMFYKCEYFFTLLTAFEPEETEASWVIRKTLIHLLKDLDRKNNLIPIFLNGKDECFIPFSLEGEPGIDYMPERDSKWNDSVKALFKKNISPLDTVVP